MKRNTILFFILLILSWCSGELMSRATWIGRVGITFFHREYNLLKIWWQGAAAVFLLLVLVFALHQYIHTRLSAAFARTLSAVLLIVAGCCLYLSYNDFHTDFSHRLLGRRFHYGFYLFWVGWMVISIEFMIRKRPLPAGSDNMATAVS